MKAVRERYRHIANYYDTAYRLTLARGSRILLNLRPPRAGERVLEIGTGTGFSLSHYPVGVEVVGIDLCPEMLAVAAAKRVAKSRASIRLVTMDAHLLALIDRQFDVVVFPHSLGLMDDPEAVLAEVARVSRPGAEIRILHTFEWANPWLRCFEHALYDAFENSLGWGRPLRFEETIGWCRKNGFELETRRRLGWKTIPDLSARRLKVARAWHRPQPPATMNHG